MADFLVISRFKLSEQLNFQLNYHRPRRDGNLPVRIDLHFGVFRISRQLVFRTTIPGPAGALEIEILLKKMLYLYPIDLQNYPIDLQVYPIEVHLHFYLIDPGII